MPPNRNHRQAYQRWVYADNQTVPDPPLYSDQQVVDFIGKCRRHQGPVCFNVVAFQDGSLLKKSIELLGRVRQQLAGSGIKSPP